MPGERDLATVLGSLTVARRPGTFVYVALPAGSLRAAEALVAEAEGTTAVLAREVADAEGLAWSFEAAWLTIEVHTALDGVGLTAVLARALADEDIACNVLAGYHHDHLLVPAERADDAVRAILARRAPIGAPPDQPDQ